MGELDPRRLEVCLLNHPGALGVPGDLLKTWEQVLVDYHVSLNAEGIPPDERSPDLLAACPPCQGMSSARGGLGSGKDPKVGYQDERNLLVIVIAKVAKALRPRLIVVENVPQFFTRKVIHPRTKKAVAASRLLIDELDGDYVPFPIITDLADFGVPQTRRRSFLTFVRRDLSGVIEFLSEHGRSPYPRPSHTADDSGEGPVSITRALAEAKLPPLDAASRESAVAEGFGGLHAVPVWTDRRYAMVEAIPEGSGRSAWQNDTCLMCGAIEPNLDALQCPKCSAVLPRPIVEMSDGTVRLVKGFKSSYRRMSPDAPAATVTTASGHLGSDLTIHPTQNRLLSTKECAVLQSFPDDFEWGDALRKWGHTNVRDMIGEAVPPAFTRKHGTALRKLLEGTCAPEDLLPLSDVRCTRPGKKLGLDPLPSLFAPGE